jgi:hypothetical protein
MDDKQKIKELLLSNDPINHQLAIQLYKSCVGGSFIEFYVDEVIGFDENLISEKLNYYMNEPTIHVLKLLKVSILIEYCIINSRKEKYYVDTYNVYTNDIEENYMFFDTRNELIEFLDIRLKQYYE